ncbi:MAG TPA: hypothetical protein VFL73_12930 [Solirubrobacteraceae bacterium]|nr:hypothetical protein [Solirubrobacteraceae bacterium]
MRRAGALAILILPVAAAACGAAAPKPSVHVSGTALAAQTTPACSATSRAELVTVARRIYDQAVNGRNEVAAVARIHRSAALARAVAARDPRATRAALAPLLKHRIVRIEISAGGHTLASFGKVAAYAPVRGLIGAGAGRYVLSVGDEHAYEAIARALTGATVRFGGNGGASFAAMRFPSGRTAVHLGLPAQLPAACASTAAGTRAATVGLIGRNLIAAESTGLSAQQALRHAAKTPAFRSAIAAGDPARVRAAIIGFFRDKRFHIVRVRAWKGTHLITDVGGPYVLSPASASIRAPGGGAAGRFMLSVQDDTGFIKLMHRFTGAEVVLHAGSRTVPGSNLSPGPPYTQGLQSVTYRGHRYDAYGFPAPAFPSGHLLVSLLMPA